MGLAAAAAALLSASCAADAPAAPLGPTPTPLPEPTPVPLAVLPTPDPAASLVEFGPYPGEVGSTAEDFQEQNPQFWINTEPLTIESLRGQVTLVDFWTYTCVNCIRTFPYLREWHDKYGGLGLTIVGVHTPEFAFELLRENVEQAVEDFDIRWPVVQDNNYATWLAYENRFWPAKYLIDQDGVIRYRHFGEGAYDETEREIRDLLLDAGADLSAIPVNPDPGPQLHQLAFTGTLDTEQTRELYAGLNPQYSSPRPYILQSNIFSVAAGKPAEFVDPGNPINNFLYFHGLWTPTWEHMRHARETEGFEDYLVLRYNGTSVNVVLESPGEPYRVYVTQDGAPVPADDWGEDLQQDEDGGTYVVVDRDRMYRIIESPEYSGHELRLSSNSDQFTVFAFTFGSYPTGP